MLLIFIVFYHLRSKLRDLTGRKLKIAIFWDGTEVAVARDDPDKEHIIRIFTIATAATRRHWPAQDFHIQHLKMSSFL